MVFEEKEEFGTWSFGGESDFSLEGIIEFCGKLSLPTLPMCSGLYMNANTLESGSWKEDAFLEAFLYGIRPLEIPVLVCDWIEDDQVLIKEPNKELSALLLQYRLLNVCKNGIWRGPIPYRRNRWVMKKNSVWK